jgi:hypothetical protein
VVVINATVVEGVGVVATVVDGVDVATVDDNVDVATPLLLHDVSVRMKMIGRQRTDKDRTHAKLLVPAWHAKEPRRQPGIRALFGDDATGTTRQISVEHRAAGGGNHPRRVHRRRDGAPVRCGERLELVILGS